MDNSAQPPEDLRERGSDILPDALQRVAHLYAAQPVPRPTAQATQNMMERLLLEETAMMRAPSHWRPSRWLVLRIVRWQVVLMGPVFWIIGVLLLLAGFLLAPFCHVQDIINLLIALLPLAALVSVIQAVRTLALRVHEVEASCPTNIIETTAALALTIVCFDIVLGVIATVAVALVHWAPFSTLLLTWLGPLLLLVGISLPVTLRWGTLPALLIGGTPWLLLIMAVYMSQYPTLGHVSLLSYDTMQLALSRLSALIGLSLLLVLFLGGSRWQRHLVRY